MELAIEYEDADFLPGKAVSLAIRQGGITLQLLKRSNKTTGVRITELLRNVGNTRIRFIQGPASRLQYCIESQFLKAGPMIFQSSMQRPAGHAEVVGQGFGIEIFITQV